MKGRITIYSITGCPHCMRAKNMMQKMNLAFTDVNLDIYPDEREAVMKRCGKKTVPQIFFNSIHVGGFEEFEKLGDADMKELLKEIEENEAPADAPQVPDPSTAKPDAEGNVFVCAPDDYAKLVYDLRRSGLIKDHWSGILPKKNSFSGKEFVDWVVKTKQLERSVAVEMGQELIDRHYGHHVKREETFKDEEKAFYRLLEDDEQGALNAGEMSMCQPRPAGELGEELRKLILKLYGAFLSEDGKRVDYEGIGGSDEFKLYTQLAKELQRVRLDDATKEERLAFFVNIYNALVIHGFIDKGSPTNIWQRMKFFNTTRYIIAGSSYSLQDVENGVLRGNRRGIGQLTNPFGKNDPRLKVALDAVEPMIHFALVCGAKSCPPIKTYSTEGVYKQLLLATQSFLEGEGCQILEDAKPPRIQLSKLLTWYRVDFGKTDDEVLRWVHDHMGDCEKKTALGRVLKGPYKMEYFNYDWSINSGV